MALNFNKTWKVLYVYDRGPWNTQKCECCDVKDIRFTHVVEAHDGEVKEVGCVCVGKAVPGYNGKAAERAARNRAARLDKFLKTGWTTAPDGTEIASRGPFTAYVAKNHTLHSVEVTELLPTQWKPRKVFEKRHCLNLQQAKYAAANVMIP